MKIGVYVDAENIFLCGGKNMWYPALKEFCSKGHAALRLNTYVAYDQRRAETDKTYEVNRNRFFDSVRSFGFKVIVKESKYFVDDEGVEKRKANADLDLAVDLLSQARNLDIIYLLSGDGDFVRMVQAVQNMGIRLHVIAFQRVSGALVREADSFTSGFVVPQLLAIEGQTPADWGVTGKRVRGTLYMVEHGYGFVEFMTPSFERQSAFLPFSEIRSTTGSITPRNGDVFQFTLERNEKGFIAQGASRMN